MPYKDSQANRASKTAWAREHREAKRAILARDPSIDPLLLQAELLVLKYRGRAEKLLANHSDDAIEARRERGRAKVRRHREKYPEKARERVRIYYAENREEECRKARERYLTIREAENERNRLYHAENSEKIATRKRVYRTLNADRIREKFAEYQRTHPEAIRLYSTARRARKANAPLNDFTPEQWKEMQAAYDHRCAYCGKRFKGKLTQDHITPLSKGGSHTAPNVIPACKSCNSRKHNKGPLCPVQPLLLTVAPSKKPKAS